MTLKIKAAHMRKRKLFCSPCNCHGPRAGTLAVHKVIENLFVFEGR